MGRGEEWKRGKIDCKVRGEQKKEEEGEDWEGRRGEGKNRRIGRIADKKMGIE